MSTIKIIELVGNSTKSWQDAAEQSIHDASESLRHIHGVEVIKQTAVAEKGKIQEYRTTLHVVFVVEYPSHLLGTE